MTGKASHPLILSAPMVRAVLNTVPDVWPAKALDESAPFKFQTRRLVKNLRVKLRGDVGEDPRPDRSGWPLVAKRGTYQANMGRGGAVSIDVGGTWLGVKPGEFDFVCPYSSGETMLAVDTSKWGAGHYSWEVQPGDGVWFREAFSLVWPDNCDDGIVFPDDGPERAIRDDECRVAYRATGDFPAWDADRDREMWRPPIYMPRWGCRLTARIRRLRLQFLHDIAATDILAEGVVARKHVDQNLGACPVGHDGVAYPDLISLWAAGWDKLNGKRAPWKDNPLVWVIDFERTK